MEICVVARAQAKPGKGKDLEMALKNVVAPTRKEVGCISYLLQQQADNALAYQVNELWASREAWEAHLQTPHIKKLFEQVPQLVAAPPEMLVFNTLL